MEKAQLCQWKKLLQAEQLQEKQLVLTFMFLWVLLLFLKWMEQISRSGNSRLAGQQSAGAEDQVLRWEGDSPLCQSCHHFCLLIYVAWLALEFEASGLMYHQIVHLIIRMTKGSIRLLHHIWPTAHEEG